MLYHRLPYQLNLGSFAQTFHDWPYLCWLDSCCDCHQQGRWDILSAAPSQTHSQPPRQAGWTLPDQLQAPTTDQPSEEIQHLPFYGGWLGYIGYEANHDRYRLKRRDKTQHHELPLSFWGWYDWTVITDHELRQSWLIFLSSCPESQRRIIESRCHQALEGDAGFSPTPYALSWSPLGGEPTYTHQLDTVLESIRHGHYYQCNISQVWAADATPDQGALQHYRSVRSTNPAPYAAFMSLPQGQILSFSPENFITQQGRMLSTSPIKGTVAKGEAIDGVSLDACLKNQAEHMMIVDLMRHELRQICQHDRVVVSSLSQKRSFSHVDHLISTLVGELRPGESIATTLAQIFPGGSITGAPKRAAMQAIEDLEPHARQIYCGSLGFVNPIGQHASLNICIRTLIATPDRWFIYSGGGIVLDSRPDTEHQECLSKIAWAIADDNNQQH